MITRVGPSVGLLALLGLGMVLRPWLHKRRYGSWGVLLFRSSSPAQHLREALLVGVFLILAIQAYLTAVDSAALGPLRLAGEAPRAAWLGFLILMTGVAWLVAAQVHLGASWRIGIDESARPGLVTSGLYAFSRNPIYLGLFVALAGFALLVPTWPSVVLLAGAVIGFHNQAVHEEAFLRRTYGEDFERYARRVGRFIPLVGRLR